MAQQTRSRPGSQEDQGPDGYDPQNMPMGDPTDPRGDLPPGAPMGGAGDPMGRRGGGQRPPVYDEPGSHYGGDEDSSKLDKLRKGLGVASGIGKGLGTANKVRKGLKNAEDRFGRSSKDDKKEDSSSPSDLHDAEDRRQPDDSEGGLFNSDDNDSRRAKAAKFLKKHKKKAMIGGGIGMGIIGGGLGLFLLLLPLKIEHIVDNLQGNFFSSSQQALSDETRNLIKEYLISRVMPAYKVQHCGTTVKQGCFVRKFGSGPVANLFRSWTDARLENKLADKGIILEYKSYSGKWYLETPAAKNGIDIGQNGERLGSEIDSHAELRASLDKVVKDETRWYQVYTRYKWGRYFERKFGLPRCVIVCKLTGGKNPFDPLHTKIKDKKIAAQLYLVQRVITPHNQTLGIVLECLLKDCKATDNKPSGSDGEYGTPRSATDAEITDALRKYGGSALANVSDEALLKTYKDIEEQGLQKYLVTKALTPIIGETAAGTAGDIVPIAGWANLLAQTVNAGNDASGNLKKLRFEVNATSMALLFGTWLVYSDEIHSGNADATELGSFSSSLGAGDQGAPDGKPVGGTAGAEQTKLYQNLIGGQGGGGNSAAATASLDNLVSGTAYADTASDATSKVTGELCNNGLPPPSNALICSEDFLGGGNSIANGIHDFFNLPGIGVLVPLAQAWRASVGQIFNFAGDLLGSAFGLLLKPLDAACSVPGVGVALSGGYCGLKDLTDKYIPQIVEGVTKWLVPDPFGVPMGGGRQFVLGAGGADYLGNDSAHRVLGAQAISAGQKAKILNAYTQEEKTQFSNQSFFARMFNGDSQYSLVSKLAMDVPLGSPGGTVQQSFASLLNPFGALGHGFGSIFSGRASADVAAQDDPFGITQYGYPSGSIPGDPEEYWNSHCSDNADNAYQKDNSWNKAASGSANADPNTGEPLNKTTNPCLLIKAAVGAAGGLYDTSNLEPDDLADLNGSGGSAGGTAVTGPTGTLPTGTAKNLAGQLVPYINKGKIQCLSSGCPDIKNTAAGKSIKTGPCLVDNLQTGLLGLLLGLAKEGHTFILSALCTDHSTADGITLHQGGRAADFNTIDGVFMGPSATTPWDSAKIAAGKKLDQDATLLIPEKSKLQFGQIQCHPTFSFLSGYTTYDDACHHQHIAVEPG